jgi:hypothetical protein
MEQIVANGIQTAVVLFGLFGIFWAVKMIGKAMSGGRKDDDPSGG